MRNLASIKRITSIADIPGKDRIGLATVDGWTVIVQKSEFKPGDLCVYVEIDSVLPERSEFEFLRSKDFRIKTMKMAGCVSQGICFPLSILPNDGDYRENDDVTELLGVTKWERPDATDVDETKQNKNKKKYPKWLMRFAWFRWLVRRFEGDKQAKAFPDFISKTDETRIQNAPFYLDMDTNWVVTEKIDGQSGTFALVRHEPKHFWNNETFEYIVCSRNVRLFNRDNSSYWAVSDKYDIKNMLRIIMDTESLDGNKLPWVAIQGECIAPNVQGNKYKVTEPYMYVFNLLYPSGRVGSEEGRKIVEALGMKWVPILETNKKLPDNVTDMLAYAHGKSAIGDTLREGVVCRTPDGKQSFKAVDPDFLIKYNE